MLISVYQIKFFWCDLVHFAYHWCSTWWVESCPWLEMINSKIEIFFALALGCNNFPSNNRMFKNYMSFWIYKKRSIKWWWSHLFWLKRVEMTNKRIEHVKSANTTFLLFLFKIFKLNLYKNGSADYFPVFCIEFLYSQGNYINDKSHSYYSESLPYSLN